MEPWTKEWRRAELKSLFQEWKDCMKCGLYKNRTNVVFGNGNAMADIMFIGTAPGENEDETGEPFIGPAGELFDALLEAAGIHRKDVFTTNLVMCRPPDNRVPTREEREFCLERLHRQIYLVDPMMIIPVGGAAMKALMRGDKKSIENEHGKLDVINIPGHQIYDKGARIELSYAAMPIFHTAYILRDDSIDPKTRSWSEGGSAHYTVKELARARQLVKFLKTAYEKAREAAR